MCTGSELPGKLQCTQKCVLYFTNNRPCERLAGKRVHDSVRCLAANSKIPTGDPTDSMLKSRFIMGGMSGIWKKESGTIGSDNLYAMQNVVDKQSPLIRI